MSSPANSVIGRYDTAAIPLPLIVRLVVGGFFIYMGYNKLVDPIEFLKQVRLYEMLPESPPYLLNGTAIVLPWLEVLCGAALILGIWRRGAATTIALMLVAFTPVVFFRALEIHRAEGTPFFQIAFDCGCGGGVVIIWKKLLENTLLFLGATLALLSRWDRFSVDALAARWRFRAASAPPEADADTEDAEPDADYGARRPAPELVES